METGGKDPALEDIEKLQEQLLEVRAERKRVEAEFDAFTQGFRTGQAPPRPRLRPSPAGRAWPRADSSTEHAALRQEGMVGVTADAEPPEAAPAVAQPLVRSRAPRRVTGPVLAVAGIAVVLVAAIALYSRNAPPVVETPVTSQPPPSDPVPAPPPASEPATAPLPAPAQSDVSGVNVTLITRRRAWMRVTIDGKRAFEREVGAGEQIPLRGERSIIIRAGDAGAVAVIWNGRDAGTVGRDGVVGTREFTRDAPAPR